MYCNLRGNQISKIKMGVTCFQKEFHSTSDTPSTNNTLLFGNTINTHARDRICI